jgi:hypothetical protein
MFWGLINDVYALGLRGIGSDAGKMDFDGQPAG